MVGWRGGQATIGEVDYSQSDLITLTLVRDHDGEITEWVDIEGLRDGGSREVRMRYTELWAQMDTWAQCHLGKSLQDPMTVDEAPRAE